jgi:hypothetical protein
MLYVLSVPSKADKVPAGPDCCPRSNTTATGCREQDRVRFETMPSRPMLQAGSFTSFDAIASGPVIPEQRRIVVHGNSTEISKDSMKRVPRSVISFGRLPQL